jgi:hypothetical protein
VQIDHELLDGDSIEPDDTRTREMRVIHTPGHSPGSISLFIQENGVLFSGDAIPVSGGLPVYDDALASVQSLQRLCRLAGIRDLLSAWDEPRKGKEAYQQMDRAVEYLQMIHEAVLASAGTGSPDPMELTRKTAAAIGLPSQAVNPLLARTFAANLRVRDCKNLLTDSTR